MGDDLTRALDRLAKLLNAKTSEAADAAKTAYGTLWLSLSAGSSQAEGVHKLELTPNEVQLKGVSNYLSRSRRGMLLTKMKGLEGYVFGELDVPIDKKGVEWKK